MREAGIHQKIHEEESQGTYRYLLFSEVPSHIF
jgi:hypothetical protein